MREEEERENGKNNGWFAQPTITSQTPFYCNHLLLPSFLIFLSSFPYLLPSPSFHRLQLPCLLGSDSAQGRGNGKTTALKPCDFLSLFLLFPIRSPCCPGVLHALGPRGSWLVLLHSCLFFMLIAEFTLSRLSLAVPMDPGDKGNLEQFYLGLINAEIIGWNFTNTECDAFSGVACGPTGFILQM